MKISFEIVPRNSAALTEQYDFIRGLGDAINFINVPDIQRFTIRSWDVSKLIDRGQYGFIPHFRAIDFDLKAGNIFRIIEEFELDRVLLVSGDPPENLKGSFHKTNVLDLIRSVKREFPQIEVYAGFDPHRSGVQDECQYIKRKVDAGADGFFSQPFYDIRMVEIYIEQMQQLQVNETYIGLSPITTESSMHYWEVKNKVQFPAAFEPVYEWNIQFANQVIRRLRETDMNLYFMPIKVDLQAYFGALNL